MFPFGVFFVTFLVGGGANKATTSQPTVGVSTRADDVPGVTLIILNDIPAVVINRT